MKRIRFGDNKYALVDDADYEELNKYKWHASFKDYAVRNSRVGEGKKRRNIYMHRQIMGEPKGLEVDHINMNPSDNRRANLRICTIAQNRRNRGMKVMNKSGFKGVCKHKLTGKWQSGISVNGRWKYLGNYDDIKEAARVYNQAALKYHGEFARLNEI